MKLVMTRSAEHQRFALDRYHMLPPRWDSSSASSPDVLQLAHVMYFWVLRRTTGFANTRSHALFQLGIVDVRPRWSIIEDCLVLSLQRKTPKLRLDWRFPFALYACGQACTAFPIRSRDRSSVLHRHGGNAGAMFHRQRLQE